MTEILVVDDDHDVAQSVELALRRRGFRVTLAYSGVEAIKVLRRYRPDLVILDVLMPGMGGLEVCRHLRMDDITADLPIIFLTARGQERDRIEGFKAGADDYVSKPFNVEELVLRVNAVLRRSARAPVETAPSVLRVGGLVLDTRTFEVTTPEKSKVLLTPTEYDLLYHLMLHAGQVYSSERLLQEVWDFPHDTGSTDLVRAHIKNLRDKIEPDPRSPTFVKTVPRHGYVVASDR
jgi:DNA-binding response OmpR family regulator